MKKGSNKAFRLGVFRLGDENVRVFASAGYRNSCCCSRADSNDMTRLYVKISSLWPHTVSELTHEAMEWSLCRRDCGWHRQNAARTCSDSLEYRMSHGLLDDVAYDVGHLLCDVLPELSRVWKKGAKP